MIDQIEKSSSKIRSRTASGGSLLALQVQGIQGGKFLVKKTNFFSELTHKQTDYWNQWEPESILIWSI